MEVLPLGIDDKKDSFTKRELLLSFVQKLLGVDNLLLAVLVDECVNISDELLTEPRYLRRGGGIGGFSVLEEDFFTDFQE